MRLTETLLAIQTDDVKEYSDNIEKQLLDFDKKTRMNYQKATYLIGKEMADIQQSIGRLYNDLKKRLTTNKYLLECVGVIAIVREKLDDMNSVGKDILEINKEIKNHEKKKKDLLAEKKKRLAEIEEVKKSSDYIENETNKENLSSLKRELSSDILQTKSLVDFKGLANVFHSSPRKMKEVKEHKSSFEQCVDKDNGKLLLALLAEANLTKGTIVASLDALKKKKKDIASLESSIKQDKTEFIMEDIRDLNNQMDMCGESVAKEKKRLVKEEKDKESLQDSIVKELRKIKVIVK